MRPSSDSERCPVCARPTALLARGIVAPFVCELAGLSLGETTTYRRCVTCDLCFFTRRYSGEELAGLYGDYRSTTYVRVRRRWEPWYRDAVNDAYAGDTPEVAERRHFLESVLAEAVGDRRFALALDYGGDEGQFFPAAASGERLVLDASERALRPGVERVAQLGGLPAPPDLVVAAHVLEHLSDPLAALQDLRRAVADGGILYAEVPLDRFATAPAHASSAYAGYLRHLVGLRPAFVAADLATGIARQHRHRVPLAGIVKQSEHLTYFSPRSLRTLVEAAGFAVVGERSDPRASVGGLRLGRHALVGEASPGA